MSHGCKGVRRVGAATAAAFLVASLFTMSAPAEGDLSLEAAKTAAAKGDTAMLIKYAEGLRSGWSSSLLYIEAMSLVDPRIPYSPAEAEREPLRKHIRCVQKLTSADLVAKALSMNPSQPDMTPKVDTFSQALGIAISHLCPPPSLEIKRQQPQK
jgi:hypothetical protein